jgi:hypothetical protein
MGSITTAMCVSFKAELATASHNFTTTSGHVFKLALIKSASVIAGTFGAASVNYSDLGTDEVANGSGYTTGGFAWTAAQNITPATSGTTAYWSWSTNPQWTSATFTAGGCMIYNSSSSNKAVATFSFGGDQSITSGTFTIALPTNDLNNAILRIT